MLNRKDIRHAAMLKPEVSKSGCSTFDKTGQHAYFPDRKGKMKCVSCGNIKT